jgi:FMN-dependent NADH-azoreductase
MPTLLHLDASPRGQYSISRQLSACAVNAWKRKNPNGVVRERDLTRTTMTFVDMDWIFGSFTAPAEHTEAHRRALAISDELISELLEADEIVIGTPMYNFAVPAVLKAWIDQVVRSGKTFQYTSSGSEGLAKGRKTLITIASAGMYEEATGGAAYNFETPYLRHILRFIGITDVTFVHAGGTLRVAQGQISSDDFLAPYFKQVEAAIFQESEEPLQLRV